VVIIVCAGAHCIQVTAGDVEVSGSPFVCEVFDVDHVYVSMPRRGAVAGHLYEIQGHDVLLLSTAFSVLCLLPFTSLTHLKHILPSWNRNCDSVGRSRSEYRLL